MINVRTKDWGSRYSKVSDLLKQKAVALEHHEKKTLAEITAHDGTHAYGRHGYQSGWESQFIRAATKITPDQAFDPRGINATTRTWNTFMTTDDSGDLGLVSLFDEASAPLESEYKTSAGNVAGGFTTPEAQMQARGLGEAMAAGLQTPQHFAAQYLFKTGPHRILVPITSIVVSVAPASDGAPYGIGFSRRNPKSYPKHSRDFVIDCIDGFLRSHTWSEIIPNVTANTHKFHQVALQKNKQAFGSMEDLCEYFDLDILWQKTATLILRRTHNTTSHTLGPWNLITMYPDSRDPGWAPSLWLSPQMKSTLRADSRFNANSKDYHWTGKTYNYAKTQKLTHTVPGWA
jgi:hypothetical protein